MSMNQANPDFNDAIQKYFGLASKPASAAGRAIELLERLRVWIFGGRYLLNERIVEYPMVFRLIRSQGRVLDIGCVSSRLPLQLASMGYEVHGVDLRPYPLAHPRFTFHQLDLLGKSVPFEPESFDIVTAISCIEHFGLGSYGDLTSSDGDLQMVKAIHQLLRPEGQLLLTVPFGKRAITPKHRIYDAEGLRRLVAGFTIQHSHFFRRFEGGWGPVLEAELAEVASPDLPVNGVAVLSCSKGA